MLHACQRPGPVIAVLMSRGDDCAMVLAGFVDSPPHLVGLTPDLHDSLVLMPAADFPDVMVGGQLVLNIPGVDVVPQRVRPFRRRRPASALGMSPSTSDRRGQARPGLRRCGP